MSTRRDLIEVVREHHYPAAPLLDLLISVCRIYDHRLQRLQRHNRSLKTRLRETSRLRRFFSPAVANHLLTGDAVALRPRRREVSVVFLDLRGFTAFTLKAEPEEVLSVLRTFHAEIGRLAHAALGTIERFTGDGLMIFFNAPDPVQDGLERAVAMALAARERFQRLAGHWRARGHDLDLGIGVSHGFASVGLIGFGGRRDYGVIGTVTNLAARLCQEAQGSQILAAQPVVGALGQRLDAEFVGDLRFKGFVHPVAAFAIRGLRPRCPELEAASARR